MVVDMGRHVTECLRMVQCDVWVDRVDRMTSMGMDMGRRNGVVLTSKPYFNILSTL